QRHSRFSYLAAPPQNPTLFPYTTLFRSPLADEDPANEARSAGYENSAHHGFDRLSPTVASRFAIKLRCSAALNKRDVTRQARGVDRKSTRLNSSHDQISYAVFCLKKKKL